ncbi:MAG: alpha/beta family hydrolase [Hyphomicrobiales bacterium]
MQFLFDSSQNTSPVFLFAHGAGVGMDSAFMEVMAHGLAEKGIGVARFEFAYMAARRDDGRKRPPPRTPKLEEEFGGAIEALQAKGPLFIGGKSMGGRIASMIADGLFLEEKISGVLCLGYPFHPPGNPVNLRTAHLEGLKTPALICQGTRDPFGTIYEVGGYKLSNAIELAWIDDGDHSFKPRRASGRSLEQNMAQAIDGVAGFIKRNT